MFKLSPNNISAKNGSGIITGTNFNSYQRTIMVKYLRFLVEYGSFNFMINVGVPPRRHNEQKHDKHLHQIW